MSGLRKLLSGISGPEDAVLRPAHNEGNPSRKMARWDLAGRNADLFAELLPGNKFLGMGGSYANMLTMFPKTGAASGPVESYFWCTPGVEAMGIDPARFEQHMDAHASNTLLPSHFHTFLNFPFEVRVYVP